jgi:hypothetical protein
MFEEIGHHVEKIKRVRYGPLALDVPPGEFRRLSFAEVEKLRSAAGLESKDLGTVKTRQILKARAFNRRDNEDCGENSESW